MNIRSIVNRWTGAVIWTGEADSTRDALIKAVLRGADLTDADLTDAVLRGDKLKSVGQTASRSDGYEFRAYLLADNTIKIMAGCRWFTLAEARMHWIATRANTQLGNESLAIVDHLERMATIVG